VSEIVSSVQPGARRPPWLRWALALLVVALVLSMVGAVYFWRQNGFQWATFLNTFRGLDPFWIAVAGLTALSTYLGRALRWRILIRSQKPNASIWRLFVATSIGFTAIVLFGRPGEMVRPYLIAVKERLSFSSQVAAWFLERIYDLLMALLIFGIALSQVHNSRVQVGPSMQWVLSVGGNVVTVLTLICLAVLIMLRLFTDVAERRLLAALAFLPERYRAKANNLVVSFTHGIGSTKCPTSIAQVVLLSILEWVLIILCYACVFHASPEMRTFGVRDVLIFVGFASFGNVIQIPGIGGGAQIVSVVVLTEMFGLSLEIASGIAVVLWAITFVVIVPFGLLLSFHEGLNWKKLRHLEEQLDALPNEPAA